jgi:FKBP-type peptidyl-prolyl cis-trans isomerase
MRPLALAAALALSLAPLAAARAQAPAASVAAAGPTAAQAFLAKNKTAPGVVTLPDGLQYKIVKSGPASGAHPGPRDTVKVDYEGKLIDGTVFDSSIARGMPVEFPLRGLIPAWVEAAQLMHPGDQWIIWAPPELAYGDEDKGPIPGGSVLEFRLNLLDFTPAPPMPDGPAFLAKNKTEPGVVTLPDGLQYKVMVPGDPKGGSPTKDDLVAVHYEGKLLDGTTFDASVDEDEPAIFQLAGLIPAWVEAISLMHPGDQWEIWAPPELAYGDKEDEQIPANSVLMFRIQLLAFKSLAEVQRENAPPPPPPAK